MRPLFYSPSLMQNAGMHISRKEKNLETDRPQPTKFTKDQYQELLDIKKERVKLEQSRLPLYRNIGFTISFLLVIIVFNWNFKVEELVDLGELDVVAEEIIDIPISEQTPPPPPKQTESFNIVEVENTVELEEIDLELDVEVNEQTVMEEIIPVIEEVEEEKVDEIFTIVEEAPEPVGGQRAFLQYIADNLEYPAKASRLNVSGRVFLKFVVEKDGSITDVQVVKGIGAGCDEEAVRVLSGAPKWKPGKQRGMPVRVSKMIPINFVLRNK